jgi:hypothetical protein
MANVKTLQRAFAGGEVSPEMFGRVDDVKYQTGLATARNFLIKPQGPAENRPGFEFVRAVKDSTKKVRLIPFTYSTTQTMMIEVGAGYFRFHTDGATLESSPGVAYEVVNPFAEADLFDIHYVQSADVLTLVHPNHAPRELRRTGALSWVLTTINFASSITSPTAIAVTTEGLTTAKYVYKYVVTAVAADGISESPASVGAGITPKAITGITKASPGVITVVGHGLVVGKNVAISGVVGMTEINGVEYFVNSVPTADTITLKNSAGTPVDTTAFGTYVSGGTLRTIGISSNLFETGCTNEITWSAVAGALRYNVYKFQGGVYGYIGRTEGLSMIDNSIAADLSKTPPTYDPVMAASGDYPAAVSYFEQRRCFAGTINKPQHILMTKSGTESNMSYSLPIKDDDRISFRVASREANAIRHVVPLTQLLLLTADAEWRVSSVNSDAITPNTISVRPQSYVGASNVQPVVVNNSLIYGAARGGHARELGYNWQANGFISGDLSIRSAHLFDNLDIMDMAYAKAPYPIVWFTSSNGKLLGLTYVPEQQIGAWHQHDTDGVFESCAVVAEGSEDRLYVVVRRTINGATVRTVERMASRQFVDQEDAFFVDCGLTYDGAAATTISGLGHLEGKTVSILADGAVHPQRVVTSGAITLDQAASKVHIGLPITADLETLPVAMQIDSAFGQGRAKNVNKAWLRVYRSSGIFVGPSTDKLTEAKQRTTEAYGSPPALKSEEIQVMLTPAWADSGKVVVRQVDPLPLTVAALTLEVAMGG